MSLNGYQEIRLARQRLSELRQERDRQRAHSLCEACEQEIRALTAHDVKELAGPDLQRLRSLQSELPQLVADIDREPARALGRAAALHKQLHLTINVARASAERWNQRQTDAGARIDELTSRLQAESLDQTTRSPQHDAAGRQLAEAKQFFRIGRLDDAEKACSQAESALDEAQHQSFDETVRREVVRNLLATLKGIGFVLEKPQHVNGSAGGGVVALVGKLPSGRKARFEVHLDGRMDFDMDGYEGRACAGELEGINASLTERFGVNLGPPQYTWKNDPIRNAKGARDLPTNTAAPRRP